MKYPGGLKAEAKLAVELGWTLVTGGSGHMKWYDPEGVMRVVTSMTPSGGKRSTMNAKARLKKFGITA